MEVDHENEKGDSGSSLPPSPALLQRPLDYWVNLDPEINPRAGGSCPLRDLSPPPAGPPARTLQSSVNLVVGGILYSTWRMRCSRGGCEESAHTVGQDKQTYQGDLCNPP